MTSPVQGSVDDERQLLPKQRREPSIESRPGLPCIYCRAPIPADLFAYESAVGTVLSATCPGCDRRTALASVTWMRWSSHPEDLTP